MAEPVKKIQPMSREQAKESFEQLSPAILALLQRAQYVLNIGEDAHARLRPVDQGQMMLANDFLVLGAVSVHALRECSYLRQQVEDLQFKLASREVASLPESEPHGA